MKRKTNFKQMYLVDGTVYDKINNNDTASAAITLRKFNRKITPTALNLPISNPMGIEVENRLQYEYNPKLTKSVATQSMILSTKSIAINTVNSPTNSCNCNPKLTKSVATQSIIPSTKSIGINTVNSPIKLDKCYQTISEGNLNKDENNKNIQIKYTSTRNGNNVTQCKDIMMEDLSNRSSSSSTHPSYNHIISNQPPSINSQETNRKPSLQYIIPDVNFQRNVIDTLPIQKYNELKLSQVEDMDISENENPSSSTHESITHSTSNPSNQYLNTNILTPSQSSLRSIANGGNSTVPHNFSTQLHQHHPSGDTSLQHLDIQNTENSTINHTPPRNDTAIDKVEENEECDTCSLSTYRKYDIGLGTKTGVPDNVIFICTICENKFKSKEALKRHMKNIHEAFTQVEKGIKRKIVQSKPTPKRMRGSEKMIPYLSYNKKKST